MSYTAQIEKKDRFVGGPSAVIEFTDIAAIHGPMKFYVSKTATPTPTSHEYVVESGQVYQTWPQGGKRAQAHFLISAVGNLRAFKFYAVSIDPTGAEVPLLQGELPH